jgi:hypothetical protein
MIQICLRSKNSGTGHLSNEFRNSHARVEVKKTVRFMDCRNLVKIHVDSAFAWFEERLKCKVKNIALAEYYEVEKEREC